MAVPNGPEDVPLRGYIKDFQIIILIKDIKSDRVIREERINYSDADERKWLGKVSFWACNNGYAVITMSVKDYEKLPK